MQFLCYSLHIVDPVIISLGLCLTTKWLTVIYATYSSASLHIKILWKRINSLFYHTRDICTHDIAQQKRMYAEMLIVFFILQQKTIC